MRDLRDRQAGAEGPITRSARRVGTWRRPSSNCDQSRRAVARRSTRKAWIMDANAERRSVEIASVQGCLDRVVEMKDLLR